MTAQEHLAFLLETVETKKPDSWATGARGLRDFGPGPNAWDGMLDKLRDLGFGSVARQAEIGMDYADEKTQQMLDQLGVVAGDVFTPERIAILRSWGLSSAPRWQLLGYRTEPTLQDVQAKINESRLINAKALFSERMTIEGDASAIWSQAWDDAEA